MKDTFETWFERIKIQHPKADETVLRFIFDFLNLQTPIYSITNPTTTDPADILYNQFANGYCYYFAHMLKIAFQLAKSAGLLHLVILSGWTRTTLLMTSVDAMTPNASITSQPVCWGT